MNENTKFTNLEDLYLIRPLTHEDFSDICEISRNIWDGSDYLPACFHEWVDSNGGFFGLVEKATNRVIGVSKFSILFDGTGWLEGLRVHPDFQGKGLSVAMTDHIMAVAVRELNAGRISRLAFSTHITSERSISLMTSRNFVLKKKYALALREYDRSAPAVPSVQKTSWEPTFEELRGSAYLAKREGLLPLAFYFQEMTPPYFQYLKEKGAFIAVNGHHGIQFFKGGECHFIVLDESPEGIAAFSDWAWAEYKDQLKEFPMTSLPLSDTVLVEGLKSLGFKTWMDWKEEDYLYYLYEPNLTN